VTTSPGEGQEAQRLTEITKAEKDKPTKTTINAQEERRTAQNSTQRYKTDITGT
jgi:hypothetical protein